MDKVLSARVDESVIKKLVTVHEFKGSKVQGLPKTCLP